VQRDGGRGEPRLTLRHSRRGHACVYDAQL
jgi:hypothetical protein